MTANRRDGAPAHSQPLSSPLCPHCGSAEVEAPYSSPSASRWLGPPPRWWTRVCLSLVSRPRGWALAVFFLGAMGLLSRDEFVLGTRQGPFSLWSLLSVVWTFVMGAWFWFGGPPLTLRCRQCGKIWIVGPQKGP